MEQLPDLMTAPEVAAAARVSIETVRRWAREGQLPVVPLPGRLLRFRRNDVETMLSGETTGNAA